MEENDKLSRELQNAKEEEVEILMENEQLMNQITKLSDEIEDKWKKEVNKLQKEANVIK